MSDVFIAHVEEDADVALEIALGLEEAGYSTWCYEVDSIPGPSYLLQTGQAVGRAKAVVVVISPHSIGSRQVTKEIIRAHESGGEFIPILRGIAHIEFQNRQPEWREAIGAATSTVIPKEGLAGILPRIVAGVKTLGIQPGMKTDSARIAQIRRVLSQLPGRIVSEEPIETPPPTKKPEPEWVAEQIPPEKVTERVTYSAPLRWISGIVGLLFILTAITGLSYFAESGLASELIVDIVTIVSAIALLLIASVPRWVSTKLKIKLEKRSVYIGALLGLVILVFFVMALGPEPPGGWWNY